MQNAENQNRQNSEYRTLIACRMHKQCKIMLKDETRKFRNEEKQSAECRNQKLETQNAKTRSTECRMMNVKTAKKPECRIVKKK